MPTRPKQKNTKNILVSINPQSELTVELPDPKLLGALLNSVSSSYKKGRVTTVVEIKKARYHKQLEIRPCWEQQGNCVGLRTPNTVLTQ